MTLCNRHKWDHDAPCIYCERQKEVRNSPEFKAMVAAELGLDMTNKGAIEHEERL